VGLLFVPILLRLVGLTGLPVCGFATVLLQT
jgi:hypothetical protein